jgi:hypothetical protein
MHSAYREWELVCGTDGLFSWEFLDLFIGGSLLAWLGWAQRLRHFPRNPSWERRLFTVPHSVLMMNGEEAFSPYD